MLLATKCPHCKTTFKVANDQLKLQSGLVRCGICHQVFNGIEHLAPTPASTSTVRINPPNPASRYAGDDNPVVQPSPEFIAIQPVPATADELDFDLFNMGGKKTGPDTTGNEAPKRDESQTPATTALDHQPELPAPAELLETSGQQPSKTGFEHDIHSLFNNESEIEHRIDSALGETIEEINVLQPYEEFDESDLTAPPKDAVPASLTVDDDDDRQETDEQHDADDQDDMEQITFIRQAKIRERLRWLFSIGAMLLLIALAAQLTYQFRDLIAVSLPASKDTLTTLCKLARCQIKLPAQLDAISYEADELHTLPRENTFEFGLLLRNHASLPQAWPHIELTLKDPKKQVVLRRVFTPSEYLPTPQDVLAGFQPGQEQAVKLYFVADKVKATDYVVAIFYP